MQSKTVTPPKEPTEMLLNPPSEQVAVPTDITLMLLIGVLQTLNALRQPSPLLHGLDVQSSSVTPQMVAQWLSELSGMANSLITSTSDHPKILTYTSRGCLRISSQHVELLAPTFEMMVIEQLPLSDF